MGVAMNDSEGNRGAYEELIRTHPPTACVESQQPLLESTSRCHQPPSRRVLDLWMQLGEANRSNRLALRAHPMDDDDEPLPEHPIHLLQRRMGSTGTLEVKVVKVCGLMSGKLGRRRSSKADGRTLKAAYLREIGVCLCTQILYQT